MGQHVTEKVNQDLCFEGINFTSALLALAASKAGTKVAIVLPSTANIPFYPELAFFYPHDRTKSWQSVLDYRFMLKCSSLFPHLFFPQRVLVFSKGNDINQQFNTLFDGLMGHDRESSTFPIITRKFNEYSSITGNLPKGNLVYEFRFDRNMAIFELLKLCKLSGAAIFDSPDKVMAKATIQSLPFNQQVFSMLIKGHTWPYKNSFRLDGGSFIATFQPFENQTLFHLYQTRSLKPIEESALNEVFSKVGIENTDDVVACAVKFYDERQKVFEGNAIPDFHFNAIRSGISSALRAISKYSCHKIKIGPLFESTKEHAMTIEHFRAVQSECDAKFDIAKQTGIGYQQFVKIFYRNRPNIDSMIDVAYEMLDQSRDAEHIWQTVESSFLKSEYNCLIM